MESAQQDFSGANRSQRRQSESLQSRRGLGTNANEAKVFKAHAAPLHLCDNLINALKLLVIQQKDGDSPIQSIVTGLHERNKKSIMEGRRSFIKEDNHRAVDVGHLRKDVKPMYAQKP